MGVKEGNQENRILVKTVIKPVMFGDRYTSYKNIF